MMDGENTKGGREREYNPSDAARGLTNTVLPDAADSGSRPMGIYIHFPFCLRKCSYCDFYSIPYQADLAEEYCSALCCEIERVADRQEWGTAISVYLGGGTPSLMSPAQIQRLFAHIHRFFTVAADCEITIEANPDTVSLDRLKAGCEAGINRISLGVQSFNESELELLGRIHSRDAVCRSVENVVKAGITNYGLDLIYGIPGQGLPEWLHNLEEAIKLVPAHLSCYLLQMEEMVPLALRLQKGEVAALPEEEESDMYYAAVNRLKHAGYQHYEISNFCRPGAACRHNLNYWEAGDYLGIGAGAVSFKGGVRYWNLPQIRQYTRNLLSKGSEPPREVLESLISREQLGCDAMIMGLRMIRGINVDEFEKRFGLQPQTAFADALQKSREERLLEYHHPWLRLTPQGYFLSNRVFVRILEAIL